MGVPIISSRGSLGRKWDFGVGKVPLCLARDLTGETAVRLEEYFGNISGAAIVQIYNHPENQ